MRVQFDRFVLDTGRRQLLRDGDPIHLSPKPFDLLALLVARRPAVVSRADLFRSIWSDTYVSEGSLAVAVAEVRSALGDGPQQPRFIRTVPKCGYAFCADAADLTADSSEASPVTWVLVWQTDRAVLPSGQSVLGRSSAADVAVRSPDVSRRHARVSVAGPDVQLEDLGSKNGTFVNGERITGPVRLHAADRFSLGPVELTLTSVTDDDETKTAFGRGSPTHPR